MLYDLSKEDIAMLEKELGYSRCLIWDNKLTLENGYKDYCDGDCHNCSNQLTIAKFLERSKLKLTGNIKGNLIIVAESFYRYGNGRVSHELENMYKTTKDEIITENWVKDLESKVKETCGYTRYVVENIIPLDSVAKVSKNEDGLSKVLIHYCYSKDETYIRYKDLSIATQVVSLDELNEESIKTWCKSMKEKFGYSAICIQDIKPLGM